MSFNVFKNIYLDWENYFVWRNGQVSSLRISGVALWCLQPWWPWAHWTVQSCSGADTHPPWQYHPLRQVHKHGITFSFKKLHSLVISTFCFSSFLFFLGVSPQTFLLLPYSHSFLIISFIPVSLSLQFPPDYTQKNTRLMRV